MNEYNEKTALAKMYQRSNNMVFSNPYEGIKRVDVSEELITIIDGVAISRPARTLNEEFTVENAMTEIPLIDLNTNEPTAETVTYAEVYRVLASIYFFLARKKDNLI